MQINCFDPLKRSPVAAPKIKQVVKKICRNEKPGWDFELRIIFADDEQIHALNRTFLNHDYPTDVISFPLGEELNFSEGEIYIGLDRAMEQAAEYGVKFSGEVIRLIIHGVLHLMGYDDQTADERRIMSQKEDQYLKIFSPEQRRAN
ncbi:MAG TPA: rRNA maturation RNase YbeY [Bacteroidetes bacterium]|nr:rRNA maturation RNase YbeY [Bacteroidota bacterium]